MPPNPVDSPPEQPAYRLPIRRPVTTAMLFLTLVVFGWKSYEQLPINLMPDISYPTLTVRTEYENAAPEDVEKLVTRPLEETLSIVTGLVDIRSTSSPGLSEIILEFTWGTDMSLAQQEVRDRLDLFTPPREVTENPVILRYDPTLDPVIRLALTSTEPNPTAETLSHTREAAERHIKSDLEAEVGIAQVVVKGGREEEIQVQVESERLKSLGLSLQDVASGLAQQNINLSGGRLKEGRTEYLVRTLNEFQTVDDIRESIIMTPAGGQVRLADVAQVRRGLKEQAAIVRIGGREAVELEIFKDGDANTVDIANRLKDLFEFDRPLGLTERLVRAMQDSRAQYMAGPDDVRSGGAGGGRRSLLNRLPEATQVSMISDQSRFIVQSIKEVQRTAVFGGLLALLVLFLFLRELRSTLIIGVAIPISVISTFVPMFLRDISLNIMSLGGLALGIGMLVDNSIVVLESIFRCREEGDGRVDAAERGTKEVASAVTASTLTTIAVFFPIAFVEGVAGQLFRDQALTVTFSLIASLLVALFLIPMIASRQRLALLSYREVIWPLRAYREARTRHGKGRLGALGAAAPLMAGYAAGFVRRTWREVYGPAPVRRKEGDLPRPAAHIGGAGEGGDGGEAGSPPPLGASGAAQVARTVFAPVRFVLFVLYMALYAVFGVFGLLLFTITAAFLAAAWAVGRVARALFWLPLKVFDLGFEAVRAAYTTTLRHALRFSPLILLGVAALAAHAGLTMAQLGRELIPPLKQGEFSIRMEAPPGTRLEDTARRARRIESLLLTQPDVASVAVEVGTEDTGAQDDRGENVAILTVTLRDPELNVPRQNAIIEDLRQAIHYVSSEDITFSLPTLFSFKTAIEVQVAGEELAELRERGAAVVQALEGIEGLRDAELRLKPGNPEVIIELDRELLAARGLSAEAVAQRLWREVQGEVATRFSTAGIKIDVRVRTDQDLLRSLQDLRALSVSDGLPPIPLADVARITVQEGPSRIQRVAQRRVALVTANVEGRDLGSVTADIDARIRALPERIEYFSGGQDRELATSYASLRFALLLAVFLVYVVMACQFESVWQPALIMFSVPLAFIGVVYTLWFAGLHLSIIVFIGGIILAGIVVNNAIVLVDYINQLRARGLNKRDAVIEAGRVRLRPILMTTTTTVLGLTPMAVQMGEGAEIRQPMAITVMAGLISATVLTLFIIPMVYDLFTPRDRAAS